MCVCVCCVCWRLGRGVGEGGRETLVVSRYAAVKKSWLAVGREGDCGWWLGKGEGEQLLRVVSLWWLR